MTDQEVIGQVNEILAEEFEVDIHKITAQASVKDVLELDSLDYVDLVVLIETHFKFKVKQEDFISIRTFDDFYSYVSHRLSQTVSS
jgi:acyl carrier protein